MALITWQDMLNMADRTRGLSQVLENPVEYKKAFDYYIKKWRSGDTHQNIQYEKLPKETQVSRLSDVIRLNLRANKGKFVAGKGFEGVNVDPKLKWEVLVKEKGFREEFEKYLKRAESAEVQAIARKRISLKDKYNALDRWQKTTARQAVKPKLLTRGMISITEFAPLTNFTRAYLNFMINNWDKPFPKLKRDGSNLGEIQLIARSKDFKEFFKDNNITVFRKPKYVTKKPSLIKGEPRGGNTFFTDVTNNAAKLKALDNFDNLGQSIRSSKIRNRAVMLGRDHELYKDTAKNLRIFLNAARDNINLMFDKKTGYNDRGLRKFLREHPKLFHNATAMFDSGRGKIFYADINKLKEMDLSTLRKNLRLEVEHNRAINDYWKNLTKDGQINAKNRLLFDAEFGHNLSLDTGQYNKSLKRNLTSWIESPLNAHKTAQIDALSKEMANLGHRVYAGGKWIGRGIEIKPGYTDTVVNSWRQAIEGSTGLKWSQLIKNPELGKKLTKAMQDVALNPKQLRVLGNMFGCPGTFSYEEGGRVRLQTGGQGLVQCVETKLKQPGAMEKIAQMPEEVGGALGKLKNAARGVLGTLGKFGARAAPLAGLAVAGAVIEPLVRKFVIDDPTTYLTDESQMKGMLLATIEGETPKVDEEILKWQLPALGAATATGAIPGAGEVYKARRGLPPTKDFIGAMPKGVGKTRAALGLKGVLGKALGASFSPLAVAATTPFQIAAQRKGGTEWGDIATDPMNWMAPAFASSGYEIASQGIKNPILLKALRMGIKPSILRTIASRFGLPGLAVSAGLWGYDKWKNRSINDED